jgi:hypothetical protein
MNLTVEKVAQKFGYFCDLKNQQNYRMKPIAR